MATIRLRVTADGQKRYHVQIRLKGRPRVTASFARKTDAQKWATQTEAAIRERRYFKPLEAATRTFGELAERYARDILPNKSIRFQQVQRTQLAFWRDHFGDGSLLADLSADAVSAGCAKLARLDSPRGGKFSPATINRYATLLTHTLSTAVRWKWLAESPMNGVTKRKEPPGRDRWLNTRNGRGCWRPVNNPPAPIWKSSSPRPYAPARAKLKSCA